MHQAIPLFVVASALLALVISMVPGTSAWEDRAEDEQPSEIQPLKQPTIEEEWISI